MSNTGPVIMGHPVARSQLEQSGTVLSFRLSDRTTGKTHYRYERTGGKQGNCTIHKEYDYELHPTDNEITTVYPMSGFDSADDWRTAIKNVHGGLDYGYIYRIELVDCSINGFGRRDYE